jgi:hypothetical protein
VAGVLKKMGEPQQQGVELLLAAVVRGGKGRRAVVGLLVLGEGLPGEEEVHGREDVLLAT